MGLVVTGILQTSDVKHIEDCLKEAGHSLDTFQVINPDDSTVGLSRGLAGSGMMTGGIGSGTGVPGLTSGNTTMGGSGTAFFRNESLSDRLGDLEIPDDEVENYVEALQAGRTIVAYFAKDATIDNIEACFREAGAAKVKRF